PRSENTFAGYPAPDRHIAAHGGSGSAATGESAGSCAASDFTLDTVYAVFAFETHAAVARTGKLDRRIGKSNQAGRDFASGNQFGTTQAAAKSVCGASR